MNSQPIDKKLTMITPRAVRWLTCEYYPAYKSANKYDPRKLVHFIDMPVLQELVHHQDELETAISITLTVESISDCNDEQIKHFLRDKLRQTNFSDKRSYFKTMQTSFSDFKVPKLDTGFEFDRIQGYDLHVHPQVLKILQEFVSLDELARKGAGPLENNLPLLQVGTDRDWGAFRAFTTYFGKYSDQMVNIFGGESKLRTFDNMEDFVRHIKRRSSDRAIEATRMRTFDQQGAPQVKASDLAMEIRVEKSAEKFRRDAAKRLSARDTDRGRDSRDASFKQVAEFSDQFDGYSTVYDNRVDNEVVLTAQQLAVPDDDYEPELKQLSTNRAYPVGNTTRPSAPIKAANVSVPVEKQVCWRKAYSPDGKCDVPGCQRSHDDSVIRAFIRKKKQELLQSRYLDNSDGALRLLVSGGALGDAPDTRLEYAEDD